MRRSRHRTAKRKDLVMITGFDGFQRGTPPRVIGNGWLLSDSIASVGRVQAEMRLRPLLGPLGSAAAAGSSSAFERGPNLTLRFLKRIIPRLQFIYRSNTTTRSHGSAPIAT